MDPERPYMSVRYDVASMRLDDLQTTPQGGVLVPAAITRTGVFSYLQPDGSTRREYRPPEEVFKKDSLDSLRAVAVTHEHPAGPVTPDNHNDLSIGNVNGEARQDGDKVAVMLAVDSPAHVKLIRERALREISAGYSIREDHTPGVTPDGEPYDLVHRDITYNHVAIGPEGWGRAGPEVRLRADGSDSPRWGVQLEETQREEMTKVILKLDGKDIEQFSEGHVAHVQAKLDAESARADSIEADAKKFAEESAAREDGLKAELEKVKADLDQFRADAEAEKKAEARSALEAKVKELAPEVEIRSDASDREIMVEAIKAHRADFDDADKSDDYVSAAFDLTKPSESRRDDSDAAFKVDSKAEKKPSSLDELRAARDERASQAHIFANKG